MDHRDGPDVRKEIIVDLPGVGGHLDYDLVIGAERPGDPPVKIEKCHPLRSDDLVEFSVHTERDQVVLVDIEPYIAFALRFTGVHLFLAPVCDPGRPCQEGPGALLFWAAASHTDSGFSIGRGPS
jgi:hypothetical protein